MNTTTIIAVVAVIIISGSSIFNITIICQV
jgi:hypothetical protein